MFCGRAWVSLHEVWSNRTLCCFTRGRVREVSHQNWRGVSTIGRSGAGPCRFLPQINFVGMIARILHTFLLISLYFFSRIVSIARCTDAELTDLSTETFYNLLRSFLSSLDGYEVVWANSLRLAGGFAVSTTPFSVSQFGVVLAAPSSYSSQLDSGLETFSGGRSRGECRRSCGCLVQRQYSQIQARRSCRQKGILAD